MSSRSEFLEDDVVTGQATYIPGIGFAYTDLVWNSGKVRQRLILRIAGSRGVCPGWRCAGRARLGRLRGKGNRFTRTQEPEVLCRAGFSCGRSPVPFHLCPCAREVGSGGGQATTGYKDTNHLSLVFGAHRPGGVLVAEYNDNEANTGGAR